MPWGGSGTARAFNEARSTQGKERLARTLPANRCPMCLWLQCIFNRAAHLRERGVEWPLPMPRPLSRRPDSSSWCTGSGEDTSAEGEGGKGNKQRSEDWVRAGTRPARNQRSPCWRAPNTYQRHAPESSPDCSTRRRSADASRSRAATFSSTARRKSSCRERAAAGRGERSVEPPTPLAAACHAAVDDGKLRRHPVHLHKLALDLCVLRRGMDGLDGRVGGDVLLAGHAQLGLQRDAGAA